MISRMRQARLTLPLMLALLGTIVLLALGTWQAQRLSWKKALIAQIATRAKAEPVSLQSAIEMARREDVEYLRVKVVGEYRHARERHLYAPTEAGPGYQIYTPLETADHFVVLVNRGFVPEALKPPEARPQTLVAGTVSVTGLVRKPQAQGWFVPASDLARNRFFWPDYPTMLGPALEAKKGDMTPAPFFLDAESTGPDALPRAGTTNLALPNRHLEYALTWFALALTLLGVFAAFARGRLRDHTKP